MKKGFILLLFFITILGVGTMDVHAAFSLNIINHETQNIDGVTYGKITGSITNDQNVTSNQVITYLEGNPRTNSNLHLISGDSYQTESYSTGTINTIIEKTNQRFPNYEIIGGINADYYNMNTGIPVEAYIREFEVLSMGLGYNRPVVGFKDNGEVIIGRPCMQGMEMVIFDENNNIRHRVDIERINKLPFSDLGTTVFFKDYVQVIGTPLTKMVFETIDYKADDYQTRYYGKGKYVSSTNDEISLPSNSFVIVSEDIYVKNLLQENDVVVVQQKLACGFEDVRFAVGAWEELVTNGVATNSLSTGTAPGYPNPRSGIGIKEDGSVILLAVDGRQSELGMDGMTLYEMADLFVELGAVTAFAFDGGGSTILSLKEGTSYQVKTSPSDGSPRRISNAVFFATGTHNPLPTVHPLPNLSSALALPSNIYVDVNGVLQFGKVDNALGYVISINGEEFETKSRDLPLNLPQGEYEIMIKAVGDGLYFSDSVYSGIIKFNVYREDIESLYELFSDFSKSESK